MERFKNKLNCPHAYGDLYTMVVAILCPKEEGANFHKTECLKQECTNCSTDKLKIWEHEKSESVDFLVTWYRFEYNTRKDSSKSKFLDFVKKETAPNELLK